MRNKIFILALIIAVSSCGQVDKKIETKKEDKTRPQIKQIDTIEINIERWFEPSTLDTIFSLNDNIQLTIQLTDSIYIPEYFLDNKALDSISNSYDNWHLRSLAIEKYLLEENKNHTKRDTSGLFIKMKNGEWKLIPLDPMTDEVDNTFEYYFKDYGYYSIRTQWGEGNGYKLINDLTGKITNLFGRPYFSPNGKYIISVNADIEAGYSENGFQLFENNNGKLLHLGNYKPSSWGPMAAIWIDNNTIKTENVTTEIIDGVSDYLYFYGKIKIINGG